MLTEQSSKDFETLARPGDPAAGLAVGVTGHRSLIAVPALADGIRKALNEIQRSFPAGPLTIVSSLAEGADRLVASIALDDFAARMVVVLPLAEDDYEKDFETEKSKSEFRSLIAAATEVVRINSQATRESAYESAGRTLLARSHALIAVWDGAGARGRGGTGEVVALARGRHLPIAWVHTGNGVGTGGSTSSDGAGGLVTFEDFPESPNDHDSA